MQSWENEAQRDSQLTCCDCGETFRLSAGRTRLVFNAQYDTAASVRTVPPGAIAKWQQ
jgi:hypothetical protein